LESIQGQTGGCLPGGLLEELLLLGNVYKDKQQGAYLEGSWKTPLLGNVYKDKQEGANQKCSWRSPLLGEHIRINGKELTGRPPGEASPPLESIQGQAGGSLPECLQAPLLHNSC
jgi:hypothetical protein